MEYISDKLIKLIERDADQLTKKLVEQCSEPSYNADLLYL